MGSETPCYDTGIGQTTKVAFRVTNPDSPIIGDDGVERYEIACQGIGLMKNWTSEGYDYSTF